jgi:hypothetical protein
MGCKVGEEEIMGLFSDPILEKCIESFKGLRMLNDDEKIDTINSIRMELHKYSPLANEPVDCVLWIKSESVGANDYNPNTVAPPEMKLLAISVIEDGYTQPIVTWLNDGKYEVVDGWHRNRVGREIPEIRDRIKGYLPITVLNINRNDRGDRIASTIRHNRARGKHRIDAMSDIVIELKRRNWSDEKIGHDLGMDPDEVLRLVQITGLAEMFSDREFSKAWEAEESSDINDEDNLVLSGEIPLDKNTSSLPEMGGLEGGDVSRDIVEPTSRSNRCSIKVIENATPTIDVDEKSDKGVAVFGRRESEQLGEESSGMVGSGGLFFNTGSPGLSYETGMAQSNRTPAKRCKRSSRHGNKGLGI